VLSKLKAFQERGFVTQAAVQEAVAKELTEEEAKAHLPALVKRSDRGISVGKGVEEPYQLLLGRGTGRPNFSAAAVDEMVAFMVKHQLPDGSWQAGGQMPDQRRPRAEGDAAATMWTVLALATVEKPSDDVVRARDKALAFLKKGPQSSESNEALMLRMLVEKQFGKAERAEELLAEYLKRQNADGGWAWRPGEASDAFGTGQALYALAIMGRGARDREVQRAWRFLLDTQQKDGAWQVPFQAISAKKRPKGGVLQEVYDYWGTTWATIGLARSLPR
jgi:squalene-hopene/tetraprenyl-beta-curcumene cyclase